MNAMQSLKQDWTGFPFCRQTQKRLIPAYQKKDVNGHEKSENVFGKLKIVVFKIALSQNTVYKQEIHYDVSLPNTALFPRIISFWTYTRTSSQTGNLKL